MRRIWVAVMALAFLSGCANLQIQGAKKRVVLRDFAEGRVVQVALTDRLTGSKEMLFFAMPQKSLFLEGYIQGVITDYDDNPIQGVVVRAVAKGEAKFVKRGEAAFQTSSFDAGVSDSNGIYRIRFSLPVIKNQVDIQGKLFYNPGWEQELEDLSKAYRPQREESPFRLFFDLREGMLVFSEGIQKTIVQPIVNKKPGKIKPLPGSKAPAVQKPAAPEEDDLFKGFGFGP